MTESKEEFMAHYGVKGMRWGRRKAVARNLSEDHITTRAIKKKTVAEMSNKELQALVTRLNLEQQYGRLQEGPQDRAIKIVQGLAKQQFTSILAKQAPKLIELAVGAVKNM